jgi:hypothetical protein
MALTTVNLNGLATGAKPGLIELSTVNITSAVANVSFTNLSTDFDAFVLNAHIYPSADAQLYFIMLDSGGNNAGYHASNKYAFSYDSDGVTGGDPYDPAGIIGATMGGNSSASRHEGMRLTGTLLGRNFVYNGAAQAPPVFTGQYQLYGASTVAKGGPFYIVMDGYGGNPETIDGFRFYMSTGNIVGGYFRLYGMSGT